MQTHLLIIVPLMATVAAYGEDPGKATATQDSTPSTTIDWNARTTGQQACVQPGSNPTTAKLKLVNANPILYTYSVDVKAYPNPGDDGKFLLGAAGTGKGGLNPASCDEFNAAVDQIWDNTRLFPRTRDSVPIDEAKADLASNNRAIQTVVAGIPNACTVRNSAAASAEMTYLPVYATIGSNLDKASSSEIDFNYSVDNKHWNEFYLRERARFSGRETNATLKWRCGVDDTLTLSVGTLLTTLPYRTYTSQSVPTGSGTQNELVVNGNSSITPIGVGLLNYKVWASDRGPQLGLSVSSGPAFKLGGTVGVSTFGWFAGASVSIWRRFFVSPGIHVGQFADFPPGFVPGSVIPANFGTLTPTTRWSARFSIGVTFQTTSLAKSDQSTSATPANQGSSAGSNQNKGKGAAPSANTNN